MKKVLPYFFSLVTVGLSIFLIMYFKPFTKKEKTTTKVNTTTTIVNQTTANQTTVKPHTTIKQNTTVKQTTTIKQTEEKEYKVLFDSDGGDLVDSQIVKEGSKLTKPKDPTKEGHTFLGWYLDETLVDLDTYCVTKDVTLKANWSVNSYTVTFISYVFDTDYSSTHQREYGSLAKYSAEEPLEAMTFEGWYLDGELISTELSCEFIMPSKDVTIRAVYQLIDCKLEFVNLGDGTGTVQGLGTYKSYKEFTVTAVADEGSYFAGWYSSPNATSAFNYYPTRCESIYDDRVLYGAFIKDNRDYTVEHYLENLDGTYSEAYYTETLYGQYEKMTNATPKEYVGFTPKEFSQEKLSLLEDTTIKIYYERNEYNLIINVLDEALGSVSGEGTYKFGEEIEAVATPTNGHRVEGWYVDGIFLHKNTNYLITMPNYDLAFCVKFEIRDDIGYKVNHYLWQEDRTYELIDTETLIGPYLGTTNAVAKTSEYYKAIEFDQIIIDPSKNMCVNIYYYPTNYELRVAVSNNYHTNEFAGKVAIITAASKEMKSGFEEETVKYFDYYNFSLNGYSTSALYNSYYGIGKTYQEWIDFYEMPNDNLDYPYFVDENGYFNPSFYGYGRDVTRKIPKDMNSVAGKCYSYICDYLFDNYYDYELNIYHLTTSSGEFYFYANVGKYTPGFYVTDFENSSLTVEIEISVDGIIRTGAKKYDENGFVSEYNGSQMSHTISIYMPYDEFCERFVANADYSSSCIDSYSRGYSDKVFYQYGEEAVLTAIPSSGNLFVGWYEGDNLLSDLPNYTYHMSNHDTIIRAVFEPNISEIISDIINEIEESEDNTFYFGYYPQSRVDSSYETYINSFGIEKPIVGDLKGWQINYYYIDADYNTMAYYNLDTNNDGQYDFMGISDVVDKDYSFLNPIWFKYEPIKWNILKKEDGKVMAITDLIIDCTWFYWGNKPGNKDHNGGEGYNSNYEFSDIRKWLNDYFYNVAFKEYEKELIEEVEVNNGRETANNVGEQYICNNTFDKVFLLSYSEVGEFYPTSNSKLCYYSDYSAITAGRRIVGDHTDVTANWLTRSPAGNNYVYSVLYNGTLSSLKAEAHGGGIRPVLWLNLE